MRRALPLLLVALALRPALAQCPDGTPPPCAVRAAAPHTPSVAILFMEPRSRNAADSLLAEGLTLEIINTLSGVARSFDDMARLVRGLSERTSFKDVYLLRQATRTEAAGGGDTQDFTVSLTYQGRSS